MATIYDTLETVARDLYWMALKDIPEDVRAALKSSLVTEKQDGNDTAERVLFTILENIKTADEHNTLVCQDTGLPVFSVKAGTGLALDYAEVKARLRKNSAAWVTWSSKLAACPRTRWASGIVRVLST